MSLFKSIHLRFLLGTAVLAGIIVLLQVVLPSVIHSKIWEILLFVAILSFLIGLLNSFLLKTLPDNFFQIMVLAMILRLISTLVFIGVLVWPGMKNIILFIADFFIIFLFYLVFDIYSFLSTLRPISK